MKTARPSRSRVTVPVVEEQISVTKRVEETGAVRVRVEADVVQAPCDISTTHEEVEVQRVAVGRVVEQRRDPWVDGDAIVVPVYEEVLLPRLVLKEEIRLVRRRSTAQEGGTVGLRRERAVVERRQEDGTWRPVEPAGSPDVTAVAPDGERRESEEPRFDVHPQE